MFPRVEPDELQSNVLLQESLIELPARPRRTVWVAILDGAELRAAVNANNPSEWVDTLKGVDLKEEGLDLGIRVICMTPGDLIYIPPHSCVLAKVCSSPATFLRCQMLASISHSTSKAPRFFVE